MREALSGERNLPTEEERLEDHRQRSGLKCKHQGCENSVTSHRGIAGWCTEGYDTYKGESMTHRQIRSAKNRERREGNSRRVHATDDGNDSFKEFQRAWNDKLDEAKIDL